MHLSESEECFFRLEIIVENRICGVIKPKTAVGSGFALWRSRSNFSWIWKTAEIEFNRLAEIIMKENGIAIDDLHAYAVEHQAEIQRPQNVHFTEDGSRILAELVAASIRPQLSK